MSTVFLRVRCEQDACFHIHCARHMDTKADNRGRGWGCDVQPGHLLPPSRSYSSICRDARWAPTRRVASDWCALGTGLTWERGAWEHGARCALIQSSSSTTFGE
jgi:hypothetical protein